MARTGLAIGGVALIALGTAIGFGWWWPSTAQATAKLEQGVNAVRIDNDSGDLRLIRTASGGVTATGLRAPIQARLSSGDLTVELAEPVNVDAELSSGDVDLVVPRARYRVEGETSSGDRDIDVPRDSSSRHQLVLQSSSGDVTVHTAG